MKMKKIDDVQVTAVKFEDSSLKKLNMILYEMRCSRTQVLMSDEIYVKTLLDSDAEINVMSETLVTRAQLSMWREIHLDMIEVSEAKTNIIECCNDVKIDIDEAKSMISIFVIESNEYTLILSRSYERKTRLCINNTSKETCEMTVINDDEIMMFFKLILMHNCQSRCVENISWESEKLFKWVDECSVESVSAMRSVSSKTVDLARLKSSEMFIKIKEEKKKKDWSFIQRFCLNDSMQCAQMLWCRSNKLAMQMTWRFDLSSIRQHEKINHVKVATAYKRKAQKIQSVNSSKLNDLISEDLTNWKQILLTQIKLNMTEMKSEKYDHWLFLKFFKIAQEFRLTSKWAKRMICNDAFTLQEKNLLLKMLFNREATMIWDFSEMRKIKDIVSFL
jgi:hypothetical protein